jgi:hypothetical protein
LPHLTLHRSRRPPQLPSRGYGGALEQPVELPRVLTAPTPVLPAVSHSRFQIVFEQADVKSLRERWHELCMAEAVAPPEFKVLFPHVIAFHGNALDIRDGNPEEFCHQVERLFQGYGGPRMQLRVLRK